MAQRETREWDANVIPFPVNALTRSENAALSQFDELLVRTTHKGRACYHERSVINESTRTVNCRDCGVALDPIYVLFRLAQRREMMVGHGLRLRRELDALEHRLEGLKREERNVKARIRRAKSKVA